MGLGAKIQRVIAGFIRWLAMLEFFMCLEIVTVDMCILFVMFGSVGLCHSNTFCCVIASNSCMSI